MINGRNFFEQPARNNLIMIIFEKIATSQGDYYITCCLLGYP